MSNIQQTIEQLQEEGLRIVLSTGMPIEYRHKLLREIEKEIERLTYEQEQDQVRS